MESRGGRSRHRKFYELPSESEGNDVQAVGLEAKTDRDALTKYINSSVIGKDTTFLSPFGRKTALYCDYTASGRSLEFIEDFIQAEVLPVYGNTHTTTSVTSLQTTLYRHEARDIVRSTTGAGEHDAVLFVGSGCTGAVQTLVSALAIKDEEVTVLVGPLEHHSNLLPWREVGATVIPIKANASGTTDLDLLEAELTRVNAAKKSLIIGCFSAASNVTGVLEDDLAITAMLHSHGALAFWDYATAAPYVSIQMNPKVPADTSGLCYKDALYFSPHKFVGGVQTPGILVVKKSLFRNQAPNCPGGGTVFYVTDSDHRYLQEPEVREEGGTPAIVESIRAGLVLKLKNTVGAEHIMERDAQLRTQALKFWENVDNLVLLSPDVRAPALPIFSFLIKHPQTGLFLHYNFVVALLNDLFGIQTRGGCACAGPHMQKLLGLDNNLVRRFEALLVEDSRLDRVGLRRGHMEGGQWEVLRPGATRINIPWFASEEEVDFILKAVSLVAREGWRLLPMYRFNNETGEWHHKSNSVFKDRRWLGHVSFASGKLEFRSNPLASQGQAESSWDKALEAGKVVLDSAEKLAAREAIPDQTVAFSSEVAALRWFVVPSEAAVCLSSSSSSLPKHIPPFSPLSSITPTTPSDTSKSATPGSLSGPLSVSASVSKLLGSSKPSLWQPGPLRQSMRRPQPKPPLNPLKRSDSVTVNSASGVTVVSNGGDTIKEEVTVNGFKSVITVGGSHTNGDISEEEFKNNFADGEAVEITFDDEETNCDKEMGKEMTEQSDLDNNCANGMCIIPGGKRPDSPEPVIDLPTAKWKVPSKEIFKPFLEAMTEFSMLSNGDKVLVCLSGGKDSLSLLHTIRQYQFYAKKQGINFEFGAVTVDPMSSAYDPRPLVPYLRQLGVHYLYEQQDIMAQALESNCSSICAFCSRMKRGRIYAAARREGYNVLALGQHLDDLAESFFMSVFHNGRLRTMKAAYKNKEGDLKIIRPLVYAREKSLRNFAEGSKLPIIAENCPACFESPKERQRIKQLLAQQELLFPRLYWNLKTALFPVMRIDRTGLESVVFGRAIADGGEEEDEEDDGL